MNKRIEKMFQGRVVGDIAAYAFILAIASLGISIGCLFVLVIVVMK